MSKTYTKKESEGIPFFTRKKELKIKTVEEEIQAALYWEGYFNLDTGEIALGSLEKYTPKVLSHELIHKYLFENVSLEATIHWDNIAKKIEAFLYGHNISDEIPYIFSLPPKQAKSVIQKHKTLAEKGLEEEKPEVWGIGLTTYKSGEIKNYKQEAIKISKIVEKELLSKFKNIEILNVEPVIGYWKGNKEPSVSVTLKGKYTPAIKAEILTFKKKYNQDAVMLMYYNKSSWTGVQIHNIKEKDINKLDLEALTYYFKENEIVVLSEKIDIPELRKKVRNLNGNMQSFKIGVEFL